MFVAEINRAQDTVHYANAGSPHPIKLTRESGAIEIIDGKHPSIGELAETIYDPCEFTFTRDDTLLLYSDAMNALRFDDQLLASDDDVAAMVKSCLMNSPTAEKRHEIFHHDICEKLEKQNDRLEDDLLVAMIDRL